MLRRLKSEKEDRIGGAVDEGSTSLIVMIKMMTMVVVVLVGWCVWWHKFGVACWWFRLVFISFELNSRGRRIRGRERREVKRMATLNTD